jgi:RNA polymerase sigma-70 factor, ECF subfamily
VARETDQKLTPETIRGLYERHAYAVFRRCRHLLRDSDDARDVMQEVFLKVLEDPSLFRGRSSPATFLFGIATHLCLNRIRNRSARDATWQASVARTLDVARAGIADPAEARQLAAAILAEADPETAAIAVYHFVDGLSQGEIATVVGRARVSVNQKLQRFRRDARRLVERS